ncbi:MAG: hypothetical protein ACI3XG_09900 [Faecousia sp.]
MMIPAVIAAVAGIAAIAAVVFPKARANDLFQTTYFMEVKKCLIPNS